MALQIPKRQRPGLIHLAKLPDPLLEQVTTAIATEPPTPDPEEMAKHIASKLELDFAELKSLIETIYTLNFVAEFSGVSQGRFLNDLVQSLRTEEFEEIGTLGSGDLRARFKAVLEIQNAALLAKALTLQRDGERLYCEAKILTDVRPVFREDVAEKPTGAVITHSLKLGYHERRGEHSELYVVLESADLDALEGVIKRAKAKEATLRKTLDDAGIVDLTS